MKLYTSGPMTGLPDFNRPAFDATEKSLTVAGYEVINPARHGLIDGYEWADYMRLALKDLAETDGLALLDGWRQSRGARIEFRIAKDLDIPIRSVAQWLATS